MKRKACSIQRSGGKRGSERGKIGHCKKKGGSTQGGEGDVGGMFSSDMDPQDLPLETATLRGT